MNVRNGLTVLAAVVVLGGGSAAMVGCESKPKGPVEKAGEKIDETVDDIDDAIDPKGPAEKAGRALDRAVDD